MSHLGDRVTPLVDGRLTPDAAERALLHASRCAECARALGAERRVREVLRSAPEPQPSAELVAGLLALGGPDGPLGPRPGHVPGTPRPAPLPPPGRPAGSTAYRGPGGRADVAGPGRRRRASRRAAVASLAVGALSLASLGLLGLLAVGTWAAPGGVAPAQADLVLASDGRAVSGAGLERLRREGWPCPGTLPGGLRLVSAEHVEVAGEAALHLAYSDGRSTVSLVEQRGRLEEDVSGFRRAVLAGVPVLQRQDDDAGQHGVWQGAWQTGDVVVAIVADAPPEVVEDVVAALPYDRPDEGWWARVGDGAGTLAALLPGR